jgi:ABC-type multidrug transport system fused ATPase/permease subunit
MTGLQTTFYIVSLIYMGLMFALFIALLVAVLVIKKKVNAVHQMVDEKLAQVRAVTDKANIALKTVQHFVKR